MRILQLIQKPQLRGVEIFASQLSTHLLSLGHDIKIICLFEGDATLPFNGETINLRRPIGRRLLDLRGWRRLAYELEVFKADILQANAADTLKFAVMSKLFFKWKTPIIFRNANKSSDFINSTPKRLINKLFTKKLAHVISVSELCRKDFIQTYSFPEGQTTTIPIGIDPMTLSKSIPYDLEEYFKAEIVLINIASLVPEKNHEGLLRIVQRSREYIPNLKVLILGDGKLKQTLQDKINGMGLKNSVFLLGYRKDVISILSRADGLLLPSLIEGLPGVILEAFSCKVPVIAYNVGGIGEVVKHHRTGWLIDKNNEEHFSEAIKEMLKNGELTDSIKNDAFYLVNAQFKNKDIAERFVEVYSKILSREKSLLYRY